MGGSGNSLMTLTREIAGALISGGPPKEERETPMNTIKIKVLRPFYYLGEVLKKGEEIEVGKVFAIDMVSANKAEIVKPAPAPPAFPVQESLIEKVEVEKPKKIKKEEK